MNSFTLTSIPAVRADGRDPAGQRPGLARVQRACRSWCAGAGRPACRPTSPAARCSPRSAAPASRPPRRSAAWRCRSSRPRGYDARLSAGSLAAGGTLGILIPPSIAMIVYATFTETSVAKLFMAGVVPGIVLTLMFMAYVAVRRADAPGHRAARARANSRAPRADGADRRGAVRAADRRHHGRIYTGVATPTEAAAAGCIFALVIALRVRRPALGRVRAAPEALDADGAATSCSSSTRPSSSPMRSSFAGVGEQLTSFIVGLQPEQVRVLPRAARAVHRARLRWSRAWA